MADKSIGIAIGVTGDQQSGAAIEGVANRGATAFERLRATMQRAGTGADFAEGQFKKLNRGVGDAAGAVQLLANVIPGLDGNFAKLSGGIGNVADVFGTLSGLLLKNPIGLLATGITAATAAFFYFRDGTQAATQSLADYEKAVATSNAVLKTSSELSREAAQAKVDEARARVQATIAAEQEQQASLIRSRILIDQQRQNIIDANKGLPNFDASTVLRDPLNRLSKDFAESEKRLADLQERLGKLNDPTQIGTARQARADEARAIFDSTRTAAERYEATIKRLNDLRAAGDITPDTYARGVQQAKEALDAASRAGQQTGATLEQLRDRFNALAGSLDPNVRATNEYANGIAVVRESFQRGVITAGEYERMLGLLADRQFQASDAGRAQASAVSATRSLYEASITPLERYEQQIRQIAEAEKSGGVVADQALRARQQAQAQLEAANDSAKGAKNTARELGLAFTSAFENAIVGGKGLREVLSGLAADLARLAIRKSLTEPLFDFFAGLVGGATKAAGGSLFGSLLGSFFGGSTAAVAQTNTLIAGGIYAKGAAFSGGSVVPFATGGLVEKRTMFPMSGGRTGMMGEAGPEAIMPLTRTADGRLGVAAEGGGGSGVALTVNTVVNLNAKGSGGEEDQRAIGQSVARQVREAVQNEIRQAMRPGGQLYGAAR